MLAFLGSEGEVASVIEASMQLPCLVETVMMSFALAI